MTLLEPQTLTGFLSFCTKVMLLSWLFLQFLFDFMAKFLHSRPGSCRKISQQVCEDMFKWNNSLSKFNCVLFFNDKRRESNQLYTDGLLGGLVDFCDKHLSVFCIDVTIEQNTAFVAKTKNCKSDYLLH